MPLLENNGRKQGRKNRNKKGKNVGRIEGRKRERLSPLFHNILFKGETASRWAMRAVWSCLFLTHTFVKRCCCCCLRFHSPHLRRAPSLLDPTRFQNGASSDVKECWAVAKSDHSSHLRGNR